MRPKKLTPVPPTTAAHDAVRQSRQGLFDLLRRYPPFEQMAPAHLHALIDRAWLSFYAADEVITAPEAGQPRHWHIIRQGLVEGRRPNPNNPQDIEQFTLSAGDSFPLTALLQQRPTQTTYTVLEDCFCLLISAEDLAELLKRSRALHQFALRGISSFLGAVQQDIQKHAFTHLGAQYSLHAPLHQLAARAPIHCDPNTPLNAVVQLMHEQQVSSVVISDADQRPLGIFTLRDLRRVIAAAQDNPLAQPIAHFMTAHPITLHPDDTAFDAALVMAQHYIGHVVLIQDGQLAGVVSERDLFTLQRVDLVHLARALRTAESISALQQLTPERQRLVAQMLVYGANAQQITQVITQLNDHITARCIELVLKEQGDPGIAFNWVAFGSEARQEQGLYTDQDNALLFMARDPEHPEQDRQRLLPLAQAINDALDACGIPLCPGHIMASNPKLCLSIEEWQRRFEDIIHDPDPKHVLAASIYFDHRLLWGPELGIRDLERHVFHLIAEHPAFLRTLAQAALNYPPPPNQLRTWLAQNVGSVKAELNLKKHLLAPMVDGVRVLSLATQIPAASTYQRIEALAKRQIISSADAEQWIAAYRHIHLLRLQQHQRQAEAGQPLTNTLALNALNPLEQRLLREALRQTRHIQALLRFRYRL